MRMKYIMIICIITCIFYSCHDTDDYILNQGLSPDDVIILSISDDNIPADGASTVTITAQIPKGADIDKRTVTFKVTNGILLWEGNSTLEVLADASGIATALLQSPQIKGEAYIEASIASVLTREFVRFDHAFPERIEIDPGSFELKASTSENITVTAQLIRNIGKTSIGTRVTFSAVDTVGRTRGQFRDIKPSNNQGEATAMYTLGNTAYRGLVTIIACVTTDDSVVYGEGAVSIVD